LGNKRGKERSRQLLIIKRGMGIHIAPDSTTLSREAGVTWRKTTPPLNERMKLKGNKEPDFVRKKKRKCEQTGFFECKKLNN